VRQLTTILTILIYTTLSYGQSGVLGCGSTYYSMDYKSTIVKSLSDLPIYIQDSIKSHLLNKLGNDFYKLLTFESCLVIDYQELVSQDPKVLNYKWQVPKYDLGFYITQKQTGVNYCCSRMSLDSIGNVIDNIDFPNYKINPQSTTFADLTQIKKTSKKLGFNPNNYSIDIVDDNIVLKFTRTQKYKYIEYLEISAHSGQKVRQYKVTGLIDWF
jgi:hypothetical protein